MSWAPTLRAVVRVARQLDRIAVALERIAEAQEGFPRAHAAPPATYDALRVTPPPADPALVERIEQALLTQLGRAPTPDEICAVLDDLPPGDFPDAKALAKAARHVS